MSAQGAGQHPRDAEIHDADTKAWWHTTEDLSGDRMEGRDTGSAAYQRAAEYVAKRFAAAGLTPAGDSGGSFQSVPMHQVDLVPEGTSFTVVRSDGSRLPLEFLQEITTTPALDALRATPADAGQLTFRGYCGREAMTDVAKKIVVCFGTQRQGLPSGAERAANARSGGALGVVSVDDPYFSIEPPRWPFAYARSVTVRSGGGQPPVRATATGASAMLPSMRLSAAAFAKLLQGTGQDAAAILKAGGSKQALPSFDIPARLQVTLRMTEKDIGSPNVLGMLPGSDSELSKQLVVVAAHLDGYGLGTPVNGDRLYNGTLDDAAYVALLIQMADDVKAGRAATSQAVHPVLRVYRRREGPAGAARGSWRIRRSRRKRWSQT